MGEAARLVDELAHRRAGGRWLATGGGGYGVYDVVPRSWSQVWSAAAHRDVPGAIPGAWIDRWAPEAARYGVRQLPERFEDDANAGRAFDESQAGAERMSGVTASTVREVVVPGLIRAAVDGGWWDPLADHRQPPSADASTAAAGDVGISGRVDRASWENLTSRTRLLPGASPIGDRHAAIALTTAAIEAGAIVSAAVDRSGIVALAVSYQGVADLPVELLWLGVNGDRRRRGLGRRILAAHLGEIDRAHPAAPIRAPVAAGDRDPIEPLARDLKRDVVTRLFESAGFEVRRAEGVVGRLDPSAILATRH
jgi:hypothetical protein